MRDDKAREMFDAEYLRIFPQGGDVSDHHEAMDSAVAALVAWAQADQTRRIVEWLRAPEDDLRTESRRITVASEIAAHFNPEAE